MLWKVYLTILISLYHPADLQTFPSPCSFGSKRLPARKTFCKLPEVFALLERTRICQIPQVSVTLLTLAAYHMCFIFFVMKITFSVSFPANFFLCETSMKVSQSAVSFTHRYPHCLHMLELLQYEHFRKELVNAQCAKFIDEQQILHWQHYSRKRTRLQQALAEQQQQQQQTAPHGNNTATKWSPSWYTPASEAYSMCTIPQVTVSRNECKYCTIPLCGNTESWTVEFCD